MSTIHRRVVLNSETNSLSLFHYHIVDKVFYEQGTGLRGHSVHAIVPIFLEHSLFVAGLYIEGYP
mgnify:CR=1 FL=1